MKLSSQFKHFALALFIFIPMHHHIQLIVKLQSEFNAQGLFEQKHIHHIHTVGIEPIGLEIIFVIVGEMIPLHSNNSLLQSLHSHSLVEY